MDGQAPREWLRVPLVQEEQPEAKAASPAGAGPPSVETLASFAGVALRTPPEWWQRGWPTPTTDSGACEVSKRGTPYCSPSKDAAVWFVAAAVIVWVAAVFVVIVAAVAAVTTETIATPTTLSL